MLTRSLIIAFLTASSSLYGGVISEFSNTYSINGTYGTFGASGNNYGTDTVSGTSSDENSNFSTNLPSGPDGYYLNVSALTESFGDDDFYNLTIGGGYSVSSAWGIRTEFTISQVVSLTTGSETQIVLTFDPFIFSGGFTGTAYFKLDNTIIAESSTIVLNAGVHTLEFYAQGLNLSPAYSDGEQSFVVYAELSPTVVPEPSSWALIALGTVAGLRIARKRKSLTC